MGGDKPVRDALNNVLLGPGIHADVTLTNCKIVQRLFEKYDKEFKVLNLASEFSRSQTNQASEGLVQPIEAPGLKGYRGLVESIA